MSKFESMYISSSSSSSEELMSGGENTYLGKVLTSPLGQGQYFSG
jgi:hypothetical protein